MKLYHIVIASLVACASTTLLSNITQINNVEQFYKEVTHTQGSVVVQFAANWCGVCQKVKPSFDQISNEPEFAPVRFVRVDIDTCEALRKKQGIVGIPTFMYLTDGKKQAQDIGVKNPDTFPEDLRTTMRSTFRLAQNEQAKQKVAAVKQGTTQTAQQAQEKVKKPVEEKRLVEKIKDKTQEYSKVIRKKAKQWFGW